MYTHTHTRHTYYIYVYQSGFLNLGTIANWGQESFVMGAVLCIVGCLGLFLGPPTRYQ